MAALNASLAAAEVYSVVSSVFMAVSVYCSMVMAPQSNMMALTLPAFQKAFKGLVFLPGGGLRSIMSSLIVFGCFGMFEVAADAKVLLYFIYIYIYNPLFLNLYIAYHILTVSLSLSNK